MTSSFGVEQVMRRNGMGDVLELDESRSGFRAQFERDALGRELMRVLPGGVKSRWTRDAVGRPTQHTVTSEAKLLRAVGYKWESNDRLRMVIDGLKGPTSYTHDALGNLAAATYADGSVELRMPDAVGNLFRRSDRSDRKYGPAGQLLAQETERGEIRYAYDAEGNLIEKREPNGRLWRYEWNGAGMLAKVTRPDGSVVTFGYDPLGRRVKKTYRGQTTRWVWDGNVPLHEWVEGKLKPREHAEVPYIWESDPWVKKREAELSEVLSQAPPARGTKDKPITWLFEPESFAPMAKLVGEERQAIITDHLGTPVLVVDASGAASWNASVSAYGELRELEGQRHACPFRWPGQYEDAETGLYYNRFRYDDPESGQYTSQDPIGLAGGLALHAYVRDPLAWMDPLGLTGQCRGRKDAARGAPAFTQTTASALFKKGVCGQIDRRGSCGLRSGAINPSQLPVDVIVRNGQTLALNTRSSLALTRAGIDPSKWTMVNRTGDAFFENLLTERLARNGLTEAGTEVLRITGMGQNASAIW